MFDVPGVPPPAAPQLPAEVLAMIDESVTAFRAEWGMMTAYAETQGWFTRYRAELVRVAQAAAAAAVKK